MGIKSLDIKFLNALAGMFDRRSYIPINTKWDKVSKKQIKKKGFDYLPEGTLIYGCGVREYEERNLDVYMPINYRKKDKPVKVGLYIRASAFEIHPFLNILYGVISSASKLPGRKKNMHEMKDELRGIENHIVEMHDEIEELIYILKN